MALRAVVSRFRVVGRKQILKDFATEFRIQSNFLVERGVFFDRELVSVQRIDQSASPHFPVLSVTVVFAQIEFPALARKKESRAPVTWLSGRRENPSMRT